MSEQIVKKKKTWTPRKQDERKQIFLDANYFQLTNNGLEIMNDPDFDDCSLACETLSRAYQAIQFALGDLLLFAEGKFGEMVAQLESDSKYTREQLRNFKSVAKAFPPSRRRENVKYTWYAELQGLPRTTQDTYLERLEAGTQKGSPKDVRPVRRALSSREVGKLERYEHICDNFVRVCLDCGRIPEE